MKQYIDARFIFLFPFISLSLQLPAQKVAEPAGPKDWSQPYPAFRIVGNLYYVGTYDLAAYLVVTPKGNILVNTGLANSAKTIEQSIKSLGFKLADTKILLTTQAHYDHMGAMAAIQKTTGAEFWVDKADAPAARDGGASDYALGRGRPDFAPIVPSRLLNDGDSIQLGGSALLLLHHPGHTKGSCSYLLDVPDGQKTYRVLIANMPTIVTSQPFSRLTAYPNVAEDYAYTLDAMKKLSFDLWLSSHASQFSMHAKHQPGNAYHPDAFAGRKDYDASLEELQKAYDKKSKE